MNGKKYFFEVVACMTTLFILNFDDKLGWEQVGLDLI